MVDELNLDDSTRLVARIAGDYNISGEAVVNAFLRVCRIPDITDEVGARLAIYEVGRVSYRVNNRRALKLLKSFLDEDQLHQLARRRSFDIVCGDRRYRLQPDRGSVARVEWDGKRWRVSVRYCIHEAPDQESLPPADASVAQFLLLNNDEAMFLDLANATPVAA